MKANFLMKFAEILSMKNSTQFIHGIQQVGKISVGEAVKFIAITYKVVYKCRS